MRTAFASPSSRRTTTPPGLCQARGPECPAPRPGPRRGRHAAGQLFWEVLPGRFSHVRAAAEFRRAIALNPNLAEAHPFLGLIYLHVGLLDQAEAEFRNHALTRTER